MRSTARAGLETGVPGRGRYEDADEAVELDRALAVFRDNVSNVYFLGYSPGDDALEGAAPDEKFRRITARIRNSDDDRVRARAGYRR